MSLGSLAGIPSNGRRCTSSVMWAASRQSGSSRRPSISGGAASRGGRTTGRPVRTPASTALSAVRGVAGVAWA